jgi:hypothetical protein
MRMRCITLYEPYATLILAGAKKIETRSWWTSVRGTVGIHASKSFPKDCRELCIGDPWINEELRRIDDNGRRIFEDQDALGGLKPHLGCVLGTAEIVNCYQFDDKPPEYPERAFGNFEEGRYGFVLKNPRWFKKPIPARGALGIWQWEHEALEYWDGKPVQIARTESLFE